MDYEGGVGFRWKHQDTQARLIPRSAIPLSELNAQFQLHNPFDESPKSSSGAVLVDWCRPAFESLVFFNRTEPGCLLVRKAPPDAMQGCEWGVSFWSLGFVTLDRQTHIYCGAAGLSLAKRVGNELIGATNQTPGLQIELLRRMHVILGNPEAATRAARTVESPYYAGDQFNTGMALWAALALMNCANVRRTEFVPSVSRQVRRAAARAGASVMAPFRYHVLTITNPRSARDSGATGDGDPIALHWTRGHFKDYREHGLFGRNKGVYWWSPHLGGKADRIVTKDYAIEAPA